MILYVVKSYCVVRSKKHLKCCLYVLSLSDVNSYTFTYRTNDISYSYWLTKDTYNLILSFIQKTQLIPMLLAINIYKMIINNYYIQLVLLCYGASKSGGRSTAEISYRSYLNTSSEPGLHRAVVGVIGPSFMACTGPIMSVIT